MSARRTLAFAAVAAVVIAVIVHHAKKKRKMEQLSNQIARDIAFYGELNIGNSSQRVYNASWVKAGMSIDEALNQCELDDRCDAVMFVTAAQQAARDGKGDIPPAGAPPAAIYPVSALGRSLTKVNSSVEKGPVFYIKRRVGVNNLQQ